MISVLFLVFIGLVVFHFWWDAIIAPSARLELRYELFKLRDELRRLKMDHPLEVDDELFDVMQHMLNKEIRFLHQATIGALCLAYYKHKNDPSMEENFQRFEKLIHGSQLEAIKDIDNNSSDVTILALVLNSGGWLIYIVPALLLAVSFRTVQLVTRKLLVGLSEKEVRTMFPDRDGTPVPA